MAGLEGKERRGRQLQTLLSGALKGIMKQEAAGIILGIQSSIKRTKSNQEKVTRIHLDSKTGPTKF